MISEMEVWPVFGAGTQLRFLKRKACWAAYQEYPFPESAPVEKC
jgi:hypothetical protein